MNLAAPDAEGVGNQLSMVVGEVDLSQDARRGLRSERLVVMNLRIIAKSRRCDIHNVMDRWSERAKHQVGEMN